MVWFSIFKDISHMYKYVKIKSSYCPCVSKIRSRKKRKKKETLCIFICRFERTRIGHIAMKTKAIKSNNAKEPK